MQYIFKYIINNYYCHMSEPKTRYSKERISSSNHKYCKKKNNEYQDDIKQEETNVFLELYDLLLKYQDNNNNNRCKKKKYTRGFVPKIKHPSISYILPNIGPRSKTEISIFGDGFKKVRGVNIDTITTRIFKIINDNQINVYIPEIRYKQNILISVSTCEDISNQVFYKIIDPPIITNIDPLSGPMGPFTSITIYGINLATLKSISYGNITLDASNTSIVFILSDTMVSFIVPPNNNSSGKVPILVTTIGGVSNKVYYSTIPLPMI